MSPITCPRCRTEHANEQKTCHKCGQNLSWAGWLSFWVRQVIGLLILLIFAAGGLAILFLQPWSVLTCRYVETTQVNCHYEERIAWLIPLNERSITRLQQARVDSKQVEREDEDGREYTDTVYSVTLISDSGETPLRGTDDLGFSADLTGNQINGYLTSFTTAPLTIWGYGILTHSLVSLVGLFVFLLFIFLAVVLVVNVTTGFDIGAWLQENYPAKKRRQR